MTREQRTAMLHYLARLREVLDGEGPDRVGRRELYREAADLFDDLFREAVVEVAAARVRARRAGWAGRPALRLVPQPDHDLGGES